MGLMGLPGAGKSTLAAALGMPVVSRDGLRSEIGAGVDEKARLFEAVLERTGALLASGRDVAVDLPFSRAAERRALREAARAREAGCLLVWLDLPAEEARRRVAGASGHPAEDRGPALVHEVAARFEPVDSDVLQLDATRPAAALVADVRAALVAMRAAPSSADER